jgi:response regulator RpfG family c-di-GMP phosphodiesterase
VVRIIRHHHTRYDSPECDHGRNEEVVPLTARVVCVADAFASMCTQRSYKQTITTTEAIGELKREEGRQFDPDIVRAACDVIRNGQWRCAA